MRNSAPLPSPEHRPRLELPAVSGTAGGWFHAGFFPECSYYGGNRNLSGLSLWPLPSLTAHSLPHSLQITGVHLKPQHVVHVTSHLIPHHELSDVQNGWGGRANIPALHPKAPPPNGEKALGYQEGCALGPRCQWSDTLIPGHFVIRNTLDRQLQPACHPPSGVNCFQHLFLFADVQAVYGPLPWASSGAFRPSSG